MAIRNRSQKIRLGVFLVISFAILLGTIGFLTAREVFEKEDIYFVTYEGTSVSGLEVGSPVKYMGINVGTIKDIHIDPNDVNKIIVELALKHQTPIKQDANANIISMGITGLKAIEINGGSNSAASLQPGDHIPAGSSLTQEITGKAEIIAQKAENVLNNLQQFSEPNNLRKFTDMADNINALVIQGNETITMVDSVILENRSDLRSALMPLKQVSERLDQSSALLLASMQTINAKIESDTIDQILSNVRDATLTLKETDFKSMVENIASIAEQTQSLIYRIDNDLDKGSKDFSESLHLLKLTLENLNEASIKINNNPSVLIRGTETKDLPDNNLK
jgi:phospholipid/cholesterol/gamma-HCH transport system substrate-binding protein